ncbi:MAG: LemA family protein [Candidatus Magasanikbacteria bacterium]|nr:LemA family protein [Candidatus Magasanikbacteria bacterium]
MTGTGIIIVIIVVVVLWAIFTYNRLVRLQKRTEEAFSDIDVQLKRRYDLIPNLVETVKGYLTHERETLQKVTEARTTAMGAHDRHASLADQGAAENMLTNTLKTLFAVSENYPDLKANQNFLQLQDELSDTENKIQAARRFYNGNVRDFNTTIQQVPANIIAGALKFKPREFFEAEAGERENIKVKF